MKWNPGLLETCSLAATAAGAAAAPGHVQASALHSLLLLSHRISQEGGQEREKGPRWVAAETGGGWATGPVPRALWCPVCEYSQLRELMP